MDRKFCDSGEFALQTEKSEITESGLKPHSVDSYWQSTLRESISEYFISSDYS